MVGGTLSWSVMVEVVGTICLGGLGIVAGLLETGAE
jgi:hypothetical protein